MESISMPERSKLIANIAAEVGNYAANRLKDRDIDNVKWAERAEEIGDTVTQLIIDELETKQEEKR